MPLGPGKISQGGPYVYITGLVGYVDNHRVDRQTPLLERPK
jgi:hypothetical protein